MKNEQNVATQFDSLSLQTIEIPSADVVCEKLIDNGSFSEVFKGKWKGNTVAIKRIFKLGNEDCEIEIMKQLDHPNLVKFYGTCSFASNELPALVIEYVGGGCLLNVIADSSKRAYIESERVRITQEIATGLEYMHKNKIIHRDVKTENMLLDDAGGVKIADFGLAVKYMGEAYISRLGAGSPAYLAPEAIKVNAQGIIEFTPKVDLYGLGGIMYTMWHFRTPYSQVLNCEVLSYVLAGKHEYISSGTAPHIKDLMVNLWDMNPTKRYTATEVKNKLAPYKNK